MGDLITNALSGNLRYIPDPVFKKLLSTELPITKKISLFADLCRINILYMISNAGSGHIGSSFSSIDIISTILLNLEDAIFFSSKGHDAPAFYSAYMGCNILEFKYLHLLRRINGLPGHPDIGTKGIITNTGSLGMGISKAKGMIFSNRLDGFHQEIIVLTGDGELQEGQIWESLISASNNNFHELTVIVDHNKLQSDNLVSAVSNLGNLEQKFSSFGWHVERCNGNDVTEIMQALESTKLVNNTPKVIIADTVKGSGVSFMEHTSMDSDLDMYKFHSGAPSQDLYDSAIIELSTNIENHFKELNLDFLDFKETKRKPSKVTPKSQERLIENYSSILIDLASKEDSIVALDADLILDTGLIPFKEKFPTRFIECGIAEQDMVSVAGGLAIKGKIPIVHSFSCFLSSRPNEQIYNNATEKNKIIYVGSLAGLLPGGPGHSHQAVRDIACLGSIPNLRIYEASNAEELELIMHHAVFNTSYSSYIRICSIPFSNAYKSQLKQKFEDGIGSILKNGSHIGIIGYGPIMLNQIHIAEKGLKGFDVKVINMPTLNYVNHDWLKETCKDLDFLFTVDNHFEVGGLGDRIGAIIANDSSIKVTHTSIALKHFPKSGTNEEVLEEASLDSQAIIETILRIIS